MPAVSKRQRRFFGVELSKARRGLPTKTGMSAEKLKDFARTPEKGLPSRAPASSRAKRRKRIAEIRATGR